MGKWADMLEAKQKSKRAYLGSDKNDKNPVLDQKATFVTFVTAKSALTQKNSAALEDAPAITLDAVPDTLAELLSCAPSRLMATLKRDDASAVKAREMLMQLPLQSCYHCSAFTFARSVCEVRNCRIAEPGRASRCVFFRPRQHYRR